MKLDLLDGALYAGDPEPAYAWLRDAAPVYRDETNELWAVSRHAELLGFDAEEWPRFARWSETLNSAGGGPRYFHAGVTVAFEEFRAEALRLVAARRARPRDDLLSRMPAAAGGELPRTDDEIAMEALLLLNGGSDTTRHVIGGAALALVRSPEQQRWLAEDAARLPVAVEEFVRWVTPILNMRRTATRDVVLRGRTIRAGDEVLLLYGAANRDERAFADPQRFDVARRPDPTSPSASAPTSAWEHRSHGSSCASSSRSCCAGSRSCASRRARSPASCRTPSRAVSLRSRSSSRRRAERTTSD